MGNSAEGTTIPYVNLREQSAREIDDLMTVFRDTMLAGSFVGGKQVAEFEARVANYCGIKEAIALNSGTDALMMAMHVAGIGDGDEVITVPNSFVASAAAVVHLGAKPVFVDVLPNQNIDPDKIEAAISAKTRAIMPVHLTGRVCQMKPILRIAEQHGLEVIEDAAQSIGSRYMDRMSGTFGRFGCFSAHPLKNLNAIGDAGFVLTNDTEAAERMRRLRNHGMVDRVTVSEWGLVSRMDVLHASVLTYRLDKLPEVIAKRRHNAKRYRQVLDHNHVFVPDEAIENFDTYHTFVVQVERRDELQQYLFERGIKTTIHYPIPIHLQPAAKELGYKLGDFPVAERQAGRILTLPVNQYMSDDEIDAVAQTISVFYKNHA